MQSFKISSVFPVTWIQILYRAPAPWTAKGPAWHVLAVGLSPHPTHHWRWPNATHCDPAVAVGWDVSIARCQDAHGNWDIMSLQL